jgi:hypothetical protein
MSHVRYGGADLHRRIRFSLEPLQPQDGLRLISESVRASKVILVSGGNVKAATITDIAYTLRDYDSLWTFSLAASWGDTKLNDLIEMKLQNKQRMFVLRIGRLTYSFELANNEFEKAFQRVLTKCRE